MKTKLSLFILLLLSLFSCSDSDSEPITPPEELNLETYHYQIPVVFHVLYKDKSNANQYPTSERIKEVLSECNKYYQNAFANSTDMNVEFVLATEDPTGKRLAEPGINRVQWSTPEMDCIAFMTSEKQSDIDLLWDIDKYINIMLYTFTQSDTKDGIIEGISHIPYTIKPDQLAGLSQLNYLPTHKNLNYPHCISINNQFIHSGFNIEDRVYRQADVAAAIAHELGHYLGLMHMFSDSDDPDDNQCKDTDFCTDTPTYDRKAYTQYMNDYAENKEGQLEWEDILKLMERRDCVTLKTSTPNNVMDYSISWTNRFTLQQKDRIRFVLTHSPLVPGPKVKRTTTRTIATPTPLPMRFMQ